jgi:hypothetical protein
VTLSCSRPARLVVVAGVLVGAVTGATLGLAFELRSDVGGERTLSGEELIERVMAEFDAEELPPDEHEEGR